MSDKPTPAQMDRDIDALTKPKPVVDAFGHRVDFGTVLIVGKRRKDGKYPVTYLFKSSGRSIKAIITAEKLEEERAKGNEIRGSR